VLIAVLISVFVNQEVVMFPLIRKSVCQSLALTVLILAALACGGSASTPEALASVTDVPAIVPTSSTVPTLAAPVESVGTSAQNPHPRDATVTTANWEIKVIEVHRGDDATAMLEEASAFNKPHPDPTMEYVLVKVRGKYIGSDSAAHRIDNSFFRGMDGAGVLYDKVSIIEVDVPGPSISSFDELSAGDEVEGWSVIQVKKDDPLILLVILPRENGLQLGEETTRYISLTE
jgi:hypothetical protein